MKRKSSIASPKKSNKTTLNVTALLSSSPENFKKRKESISTSEISNSPTRTNSSKKVVNPLRFTVQAVPLQSPSSSQRKEKSSIKSSTLFNSPRKSPIKKTTLFNSPRKSPITNSTVNPIISNNLIGIDSLNIINVVNENNITIENFPLMNSPITTDAARKKQIKNKEYQANFQKKRKLLKILNAPATSIFSSEEGSFDDKLKSLDLIIEHLHKQIDSLQKELANATEIINKGNIKLSKPSSTPWKDQTSNKLVIPIENTPAIKEILKGKFESNMPDSEETRNDDITKVIYAVMMVLEGLSRSDQSHRVSKNNTKDLLKSFVDQLIHSVYNGYLGEIIKDELIDSFKCNTFNAANVCKALDSSHSNSLTYTGYDILRQLCVDKEYQRNTLMVSKSSLQNYDRDLALGASTVLQLSDRLEKTLCSIDLEAVIAHLIISSGEFIGCKAEEINSKEMSEITYTYTLDGALLTQHKAFTITALGCKDDKHVKVLGGVTTNSNKDLTDDDIDEVSGVLSPTHIKYHSPYNYVLLSFMNRNDTDENSFKLIANTIAQIKSINEKRFMFIDELKEFHRVRVIYVMDLKAFMTLFKAGGGSYLGKYFCPFCPCLTYHKGEKSIFNTCENSCFEKQRECYCYKIVDAATIEKNTNSTKMSQKDLDCFVDWPKSTDLKGAWSSFAEYRFPEEYKRYKNYTISNRIKEKTNKKSNASKTEETTTATKTKKSTTKKTKKSTTKKTTTKTNSNKASKTKTGDTKATGNKDNSKVAAETEKDDDTSYATIAIDDDIDDCDPTIDLLKPEIIEFVKMQKERYIQLNNVSFDTTVTDDDVLFHLSLLHHHPDKHKENFDSSVNENDLQIDNHNNNQAILNRAILKILIRKGYEIGYCLQFNHPLSMIKDPQNCCICLMHLIMRVSEKLITRLLQEAFKFHGQTKYERDIKPAIEGVINHQLSSTFDLIEEDLDYSGPIETSETISKKFLAKLESLEEDCSYDFQLHSSSKTKGPDDFKISYSRMLKLLEVIERFILVCCFDSDTSSFFTALFLSWKSMMQLLFKEDEDFKEEELTKLWDVICTFRDLYLGKFGANSPTNYIHIIISGHLIEMIKKFGSISKYSGIGFESLIGRTRSFICRRTNGAGHVGGKKKIISTQTKNDTEKDKDNHTENKQVIQKHKATHAENIYRCMLRRLSRQLSFSSQLNVNGDKYNLAYMKSVGSKLNAKERNIYNKRYRALNNGKLKEDKRNKRIQNRSKNKQKLNK